MIDEKNFAKHYPDRCRNCFMRNEVCICELFKKIDNQVPLTIVMHKREARKTTNTGRLALKMLQQSRVLLRGVKDQPLQLDQHIKDPENCLLLAYSPEAKELSPEFLKNLKPVSELVVLDGSWSHASRMLNREPMFKQMQLVTLPPGPPSRFLLREEPHKGGLATVEAIARAYGLIENHSIQQDLESVFYEMVERTLKTRPKNRQDQNRKRR